MNVAATYVAEECVQLLVMATATATTTTTPHTHSKTIDNDDASAFVVRQ